MKYPESLKEYFQSSDGINTMLVKKNRRVVVAPPVPHRCVGATDQVGLQVSYRGSDWRDGVTYAVEVNGVMWNEDGSYGLLNSWGGEPYLIYIGDYTFETTFEGKDGPATLRVLPNHNTDYINVKLINKGYLDDNVILGVTGGGPIEYDSSDSSAEFCLKPEPKEPITCLGASDRFSFSTDDRSMARAMLDDSGLEELVYNVTLNGRDYGTIDFVQTPKPMFGDVGLELMEDPYDGTHTLKLVGGNVGESKRFIFTSVPERGGNNIFMIVSDSDDYIGTDPTIEYNPITRDVEVCMVVMGRCDGAIDYIQFYQYDPDVDEEAQADSEFPLIYNVTVNGVDYGVIDFTGDDIDEYRVFGDYSVRFEHDYWGMGGLYLAEGPINIPAHFVLDPVDPINSNINNPDDNRTVIYDYETKRIEFCLVLDECTGASDEVGFNMDPGGSSDNFTELYHSIEIDGQVLNGDNEYDLLSEDPIYLEDGGLAIEWSVGYDSVSMTARSSASISIKKVKLVPPSEASGKPNYISEAYMESNPTIVANPDGSFNFCLVTRQPA